MFSNDGSKLKAAAYIIFIIGIIGDIVALISTMSSSEIANEFKLLCLFFILVAVVAEYIFCWILHSIGEILDKLGRVEYSQTISEHVLKKSSGKEEGLLFSNRSQEENKKPASTATGWTCNQCGSMNDERAIYCKYCGKYK